MISRPRGAATWKNTNSLFGALACPYIFRVSAIDAILEAPGGRPSFAGCHADLLLDISLLGSLEAPDLVNRSIHGGSVTEALPNQKCNLGDGNCLIASIHFCGKRRTSSRACVQAYRRGSSAFSLASAALISSHEGARQI
jgi:hypothetical protein